MTARKRGDVAGLRDELRSVVHQDPKASADVVLEMRSLAALGLRDGLDVVRPAPPGLEDEASDLGSSDVEDLGSAIRELARLIRTLEALVLCVVHLLLLSL